MSQVKFFIVEGPNYEHLSIGLFEMEVIPRIGEFVLYEKEGDDPHLYKAKDVVHSIMAPETPIEIWLVSLEDEKYH